MVTLHTETPLAKAIFELFNDLAQLIKDNHRDLVAGSITAYRLLLCDLCIEIGSILQLKYQRSGICS
jgi:hypothetical protein